MAEEIVTQEDVDEVEESTADETPTDGATSDDVTQTQEESEDIDTTQTVDEVQPASVDETSTSDMDMVQLEQRVTSLEQRLLSLETTPAPQPEPQPEPQPQPTEDDSSDVDEIEDALDL